MDLPTEAQLEYLGTAFGRSPVVWGNDAPGCEDAVLGRSVAPLSGDASCTREPRQSILPATASELSRTRDVLRTAGGPVFGLASNVAEWTREAFAPRTAGCGMPAAGPVLDPECAPTKTTQRIAVRGASFTSTPLSAAAAVRAFVVLPLLRADVGFRCVR
jgi:formylglycine-generating enzyme required for sulfatase activity